MSADLSSLSQPELSLGSLASFTTNNVGSGAQRIPSSSSRTTSSAPVATPPSATFNHHRRQNTITSNNNYNDDALSSRLNVFANNRSASPDDQDHNDGDVLGTPAVEKGKRNWGLAVSGAADATYLDVPGGAGGRSILTPGAGISSRQGAKANGAGGAGPGKGATLTLRDQEKHIDNLKKENFNIKLRVHFLEEKLSQLAPEQVEASVKQNISLKIELHNRGQEIKKLKKLLKALQEELEKLQQQQQQGGLAPSSSSSSSAFGTRAATASGSTSQRERELEALLDERDRELAVLRRRSHASYRSSTGGNNDDLDEEREMMLREAEARNAELEEQLDNMRALLEDNVDEIDRLREIVESRNGAGANGNGNDVSSSSSSNISPLAGRGSRGPGDDLTNRSQANAMQREVEALQDEVADLRARLQDQEDELCQRMDEKEDILSENELLRLTVQDLERRRDAESFERSESRAQMLEEREEREAAEMEINALKDRLATVMLELQAKEDDLEMKEGQIEGLIEEHKRIVEVVENEWKEEVAESKMQAEELKDVLSEREAECEALRGQISELEAEQQKVYDKFEAALAGLEAEASQKEVEIENMQSTIDKLGEQMYHLEDENDRLKEEMERFRVDEAAERERLESLNAAFKEKIAELKSKFDEANDALEQYSQEIHAHRARQEELATHVEQLVAELESERSERAQLEQDYKTLSKEQDATLRSLKRSIDNKEASLQSTTAELGRTKSLLEQREKELNELEDALRGYEKEQKRLGETHTTAQFSLQLETDRLKRDLERVEDDLRRARKELDDKSTQAQNREAQLDKLHGENRDLASQLAAQTQARLNLSEKLDSAQASVRTLEGEREGLKARLAELEARMSKEQRSLLGVENQYRDQLTERNTLLLTIYQYLDKILGVDKTPKKSGQAETKPFTNFSVFHDNLITRLKALSQIQLDFDKKAKELESRHSDRLTDLKRQLENRWRQLDKFEQSLKTLSETKLSWKKKFAQNQGELDALKATNSELSAQLSSIRRGASGTADIMELRAANARATNAERRLNNAQNQLAQKEEQVLQLNQSLSAASSKWDARVKEYEARLRAAEERVKRERQGGKERAFELEASVKTLQRQLELAQKRSAQLGDVVESTKGLVAAGSQTPGRS